MAVSRCQEHFVRNVWDFCDQCQNKTNINWKCVQCHQFLCEACYNSHINGRITREHVVFTKDKQDKETELQRIYKCDQHGDRNVTMYCNDDDVPICTKCMTEKHRRHDIIDLETAADNLRGEIQLKINEWKEGRARLHAIEKAEREMTDYTAKCIKEINVTTTDLMEKLPQMSKSLIRDFEIERQKMIQEFSEMKFKLSLDIRCGEDHIDEVDHSVKYFRDGEIIRKGQQMLQKISLNTNLSGIKCTEKYMKTPITSKQKLTRILMQKYFRSTGSDKHHSAVHYKVDTFHFSSGICIYIGSDKISVTYHLRSDGRIIGKLGDVRLWIDDKDGVQLHFGSFNYTDVEKKHHIFCSLQPVSRNGEVFFKSMDGMEFNGRKLFQSIFKMLQTEAQSLFGDFLSGAVLRGHVNLMCSETLRDHLQYLCKDLNEQHDFICSDAQAFAAFHRSILDHNETSQVIVVQIDFSTTISAHRNDDSQVLSTPVVCSGLMELTDRFIYIFKSILGESPFSTQLDTNHFRLHLQRVLVPKMKQHIRDTIRLNPSLDFDCLTALKKSLKKSVYQKDVSINQMHIELSQNLFLQQVEEVSKAICSNISYVLSLMDSRNLPSLLLISEHGTFDTLTDRIATNFPDMKIRKMASEEITKCIDAKIRNMRWGEL